MADKTEKDLPQHDRQTYLKAMSALQLKNYGYAVQLFQAVLKNHPDFLLARQLARKAAVGKSSGKKSLLGGISSVSFSTLKTQALMKKDPAAAIDAIEKTLENDPYNTQANQMLRDAALAMEMPNTAAFALETIVEGNPKDTKTMHELAQFYIRKLEEPEKALNLYNRIVEINPSDLEAIKGAKDASARGSMMRGGWEKEENTYRELIRNKEEAVSLEQQGRVVRSEEMINQQLAELHDRVEKEPQNVDVARRIASLYEQKDDLENAINWYHYSAELGGNSDLALVRKTSDLRLKQFDQTIQQWVEYLAANPDNPEKAEHEKELARLREERAGMLIDEARKRVERNPTDLMFRFELGEILINAGHQQEAIPELQKARQNPSVRIRAMSLLGKCYTAKSMYDLAAKTLSDAVSELQQMDSIKKDIVYNLGLIYEKMGKKEESLNCMKQIYEVDYGYLDVAARVEGSYGQ